MGQSRSYLTVSEMLDQAVLDTKCRGYTIGSAIEQVAEFFGLSASKVKRHIYYGDEAGTARDQVYQRYLDHLTHEEQQVARKLAAVRARIEQVRQS